jgi:hypothetical protein
VESLQGVIDIRQLLEEGFETLIQSTSAPWLELASLVAAWKTSAQSPNVSESANYAKNTNASETHGENTWEIDNSRPRTLNSTLS